MFVWGTVTVSLFGKSRRIWYPYVATWILGFLLETSIFFANDFPGVGKIYHNLDPAFHVSRIICLASLAGSGLFYSISCKVFHRRIDEEDQPLLVSRGRANENYSSIASDDEHDDFTPDNEDDGPERTKELREKQKQRLQACGSWIAYLKDFRLLAKLAWPSADQTAQICLAVLIVIILADRALNLLVPRQLGIITDKLATMHETGKVDLSQSLADQKADRTQVKFLSRRLDFGCFMSGSIPMQAFTQSPSSASYQSSNMLTGRSEQQHSVTS